MNKRNIILIMIFCLMGNVIQAKNLESNELESNVPPKKIDIYEDWEVDRYNNIVRYSTHGSIVHGHRFGWIKKAGNCDTDILATTISTKKINKERLYDFKGESIDLRINFPQAEGEDPAIINTDLIGVFDFATLKIAFFGNFIQGQMFDSLMAYFNTIKVEITNPHKIYFDIPSDEYSLNGYVAAKLKAKELCEEIVKTTSL
ncbi:MAG: hypothetical protein ACKVHZ_04840 [Burkholderiales bacterium]|jgi:hypothetical protein|tara:strand:- start:34 stop:639 length:606 start_codon:yes stop_codon:yes gene_type:complete